MKVKIFTGKRETFGVGVGVVMFGRFKKSLNRHSKLERDDSEALVLGVTVFSLCQKKNQNEIGMTNIIGCWQVWWQKIYSSPVIFRCP
jgi:hypothetical protein